MAWISSVLLRKLTIVLACAIFVGMATMTSIATYNYDCACAKKSLEGMENASLSSAEYYTLSSLISQIEKDDPDFKYEFDVKAMLHIGSTHAAYATILNSDKSIEDKISGVKLLLADEPVNQYMEKAFTDPPPDTK